MADFKLVEKRRQGKLSSVSGVVATVPILSAVTNQDYPDTTWIPETDIMEGEWFFNIPDQKVQTRLNNTIIDIGFSGQTGQWTLLGDTPGTIQAGQWLRGSSGGTSLEWFTFTGQTFTIAGANDYVGVPTSANTGQFLTYDSASGFTLASVNRSITGMTDVSTALSAYTADYLLKTDGSQVTFYNPFDNLVGLNNSQTIPGAKIFSAATIFEAGVELYRNLKFSGVNEVVTINNISTNISFSDVSNQELATTLATRTYIDSQVWATGATTFVRIAGDDSISGIKTFNGPVIINSGLTLSALTVTDDIIVSGDTINSISSINYFGATTAIGSWRNKVNVTGELEWEQFTSSGWTWAYSIGV